MSLFEVGAHRGNRKSKLNPRLKKSVYGTEHSLCIINLVATKETIDTTSELLYKLGQKRKQILVVGTSKHLKEFVPVLSESFSSSPMPFVDNRWLGGTLTNWSTIKKTLKTLEKLQSIESNKEFFNKLARNEQLSVVRKKDKILKFFRGLVNLKSNKPGAILVLDAHNNPIAIEEADSMGIPVIALTNTNTLSIPKNLKYTIVCNNNSINAVKLIADNLIDSYNQGLAAGVPVTTDQMQKEVEMAAETTKEPVSV